MCYVMCDRSKQRLMLSVEAGRLNLTADLQQAIRFYDARSAAAYRSTNSGLKEYVVTFMVDEEKFGL